MAAAMVLSERGYLELSGSERGVRRRARELIFSLTGSGEGAAGRGNMWLGWLFLFPLLLVPLPPLPAIDPPPRSINCR